MVSLRRSATAQESVVVVSLHGVPGVLLQNLQISVPRAKARVAAGSLPTQNKGDTGSSSFLSPSYGEMWTHFRRTKTLQRFSRRRAPRGRTAPSVTVTRQTCAMRMRMLTARDPAGASASRGIRTPDTARGPRRQAASRRQGGTRGAMWRGSIRSAATYECRRST